MKKFNLRPGQLHILLLHFKEENVRQIDLAAKLNLDKTNMARTISILEDKGYIQHHKDEQDSRVYNIRLTPQAKKYQKQDSSCFGKLD